LARAEVGQHLDEAADGALLRPPGARGRMPARAREPGAVARTRNLHEPLRPAAHGADLVAERGTASARSPFAAERAQHSWALLYNPARNRQSSSERALQSPEVVVER